MNLFHFLFSPVRITPENLPALTFSQLALRGFFYLIFTPAISIFISHQLNSARTRKPVTYPINHTTPHINIHPANLVSQPASKPRSSGTLGTLNSSEAILA